MCTIEEQVFLEVFKNLSSEYYDWLRYDPMSLDVYETWK